jgi:hypothetical protein
MFAIIARRERHTRYRRSGRIAGMGKIVPAPVTRALPALERRALRKAGCVKPQKRRAGLAAGSALAGARLGRDSVETVAGRDTAGGGAARSVETDPA